MLVDRKNIFGQCTNHTLDFRTFLALQNVHLFRTFLVLQNVQCIIVHKT